MMRFTNDFHSWLRHSWKSFANRLTRDPKIVIHGNSCIIPYIIAKLCRCLGLSVLVCEDSNRDGASGTHSTANWIPAYKRLSYLGSSQKLHIFNHHAMVWGNEFKSEWNCLPLLRLEFESGWCLWYQLIINECSLKTVWSNEDRVQNLNSIARPYHERVFTCFTPLTEFVHPWPWRWHTFVLTSLWCDQYFSLGGVSGTHSPANWIPAYKPTELPMVKSKTLTAAIGSLLTVATHMFLGLFIVVGRH